MHGSLGSLQALRFAADEARQRNVPLLAVTAWVPPGGDLAERRHSSPHLRKIWRDAAWERLWAAFDAGLGGVPADLHVETQAVRGDTGPVLVDTADQPDDLLIIGTGRRAGFGRMMRRSVSRYCLAHAHCPVLAVPPSALMDEMSHPLHSWHIRRHELTPDTPGHLALLARLGWPARTEPRQCHIVVVRTTAMSHRRGCGHRPYALRGVDGRM